MIRSHLLTSHARLCCFRCIPRHPSYQANHPQNTSGLFSHGHGYRALDGDPHGPTRRIRSRTSQLLCRGSSRDGSKGQAIRERFHPRPCRAFTEDNRGRSEGTEGEVGIRWISSHGSVFLSRPTLFAVCLSMIIKHIQITFVHPKRCHRTAETHSSTL